ILGWNKQLGDLVEEGEILLEIETDKVNYGLESPAAGVLHLILASPGDMLPVGAIVAVLGQAEERIDASQYQAASLAAATTEASPAAQAVPEPIPSSVMTGPSGSRVLISPTARKLARQKGVDLSLVQGTGISGRIRLADVERYLAEAKPVVPEAAARPQTPPSLLPEVAESIPLSSMRQVIARRLTQSSREAPHFNLCTEVDMTEAKNCVALFNEKFQLDEGRRISLNDLFIKVAAMTLRQYPLLNARLTENNIEIMREINIGLAVALDDGLIVPALEKADQKKLALIAQERKDLVDRAREGKLSLMELERGTFTISNLGQYEITFFTSILNPPQTGILSIGKTMDRPVVRNKEIVIRPMAALSLAIDHRVVDGAVGARFLQDLKDGLENPLLLL
ncbi:MAG: dihydrolipoamide acetyltransferase family protein, partial [Pseudomonadota bacterium]